MNRKLLDYYQQMHHEAVLRVMFEDDAEEKRKAKDNLYHLELSLLNLIGLENFNQIRRRDGLREVRLGG